MPPAAPYRRTRLALAVAMVVGGVVAALATTSGTVTSSTLGFAPLVGRFAGYSWDGRVVSVQASWRVPRVLADSPPGFAGTWIGASGPGAHSLFIQVGTNEYQAAVEPPATQRPGPYFDAFWSDTKHHFFAQHLFVVSSGDVINAGLALGHGRWRVRLVDSTSGRSAVFSTSEEANGSFDEAAWLQEHLVNNTYPRLSPIVFRDLEVNASAPSSGGLGPRWLSLGQDRFVVPSVLTADSFTVGAGTRHAPPP